jgi:GNAT superfamily N-acetyltransferase
VTISTVPLIRRGTLSDAALLAELGARTFSDTFAADNAPADMAAYLEAAFSPQQQGRELSDPSSTFLIAEIDGQAAGYAMLRPSEAPNQVSRETPIELVRLYVLGEWHGRGVAAALMQRCLEEATRRGCRTLWLGVWEQNARAQAFYRKWKFAVVGDHVFQLGTDAQRDLLMERKV